MTVYTGTPIYNYLTYSVRERIILNQARAAVIGKPTLVVHGIHTLFSCPIWDSGSNADEELYFKWHVPRRWNGTSDLTVGCHAVIDTANTNKKFKFNLDWASCSTGMVETATSTTAACEITTGTDAQYYVYPMVWTIDYDAVGGQPVLGGDVLSGRIRRVAASSAEMTGEPMLHGFYAQFNAYKVGTAI
jgi:hypothetical protein